jgi:type IV pilus assembly protein PilC
VLAPVGDFLGWFFAWPLRILATAPLVGPLYFWHAIAEWSRLVALLVDARVPLPDAIELAAHGVRSSALARAMPPIAAGVRQGHSLAQLIAHSFWMPASLGPLVEWGEKTGQLGEALRTAAEMFDGRIRLRATLLKQIVPPILFLIVASCLALIVAAIFGPLVRLIQTLS